MIDYSNIETYSVVKNYKNLLQFEGKVKESLVGELYNGTFLNPQVLMR